MDSELAAEPHSPSEVRDGETPPDREAIPVRRFLSDTAIFGLVSGFDRAIGFLLLPVTTALMVPSEYGVLGLFQTTTDVLQYVIAMGAFNAFFKYYMEVVDPAERRQILNATFWQVTTLATLAALIFIPFAPFWNRVLFNGEGILFPLMTVSSAYMAVLISLGDCRLQADGRAMTFFWVSVLQTITLRGLSLALLFIGWGAAGWVVGQFAGQCVTVTAFAFLAFVGVSLKLDRTWMKRIFLFGAVLMPLAVSHWAMQGSAKYVMNFTFEDPLHQIGLYGVGERIAQIMTILNLAFALGWRRFAFSNMHHADGPRLLGHGATVFYAISAFTALGLVALGDDLTRLMIRSDYWEGIPVITPLIIAGFLWGLTEVIAISLYKVNKTYLLSASYIAGAVASIVLNLILIPTLGIIGGALAWMLAELFKLLLVWYFGQREFALDIGYGRIALATAVYVPLAVICVMFFPDTNLVSVLAQMGIVALAPVLLVMMGYLTPSEWESLRSLAQRLHGKLRRRSTG